MRGQRPDPRVRRGERELRFIMKWTGSSSPRGSVLDEAFRRDRGSRAVQHVLESGIYSGSAPARYTKAGCMFVFAAMFCLIGAFVGLIGWIVMGALGVFYLYCALLLALSPNVTAFMRELRDRPGHRPGGRRGRRSRSRKRC